MFMKTILCDDGDAVMMVMLCGLNYQEKSSRSGAWKQVLKKKGMFKDKIKS